MRRLYSFSLDCTLGDKVSPEFTALRCLGCENIGAHAHRLHDFSFIAKSTERAVLFLHWLIPSSLSCFCLVVFLCRTASVNSYVDPMLFSLFLSLICCILLALPISKSLYLKPYALLSTRNLCSTTLLLLLFLLKSCSFSNRPCRSCLQSARPQIALCATRILTLTYLNSPVVIEASFCFIVTVSRPFPIFQLHHQQQLMTTSQSIN